MSLATLSILENATVTPSGGTALPLTSAGGSLDKNTLIVDADTDLRTQRSVDFSVSRPKVQGSAPNGYTQARSSVILKIPRTLANGNTSVDTVFVKFSTDVETTVAEKDEMRALACQLLIDSETDAFWTQLIAG